MNNKANDQSDTRTAAFARNHDLELLLTDINSSLWLAEKSILKDYQHPDLPIIFVMGPMRSGTTLLMQWLADTSVLSYPSNLLSRFYQAPVIGAKIQLMLTDPRFNFRNELPEFVQQTIYESENGKTRGALAPNEFWYFWRRFLPKSDYDVFDNKELVEKIDTKTMLSELAGIVDVFKKPFACKGMLFNNNIEFLHTLLKNALFIYSFREPIYNMQSVLLAREKQFGSRDRWYSFRVKQYDELSRLDPVTQVAGQIYFINKAVSEGLSKIPDANKIAVPYEEFCHSPASIYDAIAEKLAELGYPVTEKYSGKNKFKSNNTWAGSTSDKQLFYDAYKSFAGP